MNLSDLHPDLRAEILRDRLLRKRQKQARYQAKKKAAQATLDEPPPDFGKLPDTWQPDPNFVPIDPNAVLPPIEDMIAALAQEAALAQATPAPRRTEGEA